MGSSDGSAQRRHASVLDAVDALREAAAARSTQQSVPESQAYRAAMRRLEATASAAGYVGLSAFTERVGSVFDALCDEAGALTDDGWSEFRQWPGLLYSFLDSPHTEHARRGLLGWLRQPALGAGVDGAEGADLFARLPLGLPGADATRAGDSSTGDWPRLSDDVLELDGDTDELPPPLPPFDATPAAPGHALRVSSLLPVSGPGTVRISGAMLREHALGSRTGRDSGSTVDAASRDDETWPDADMPPPAVTEAELERGRRAHDAFTRPGARLGPAPAPADVSPLPARSNAPTGDSTSPGRAESGRERSASVGEETAEILSLLRGEFSTLHPPASVPERGALGRFSGGCEEAGLDGLAEAVQALGGQVERGATAEALLPARTAVLGYLAAPRAPRRVDALVEALRDSALPAPLDSTAGEALALALASPRLDAVAAELAVESAAEGDVAALAAASAVDAAPVAASDADPLDLSIPPNVEPAVLDAFLAELPTHSEALGVAIQRLVSADGTLADADAAMRSAHTLKGAAGTVGVQGIATFTHRLEEVVQRVRRHRRRPALALGETLTRAADCVATMGEHVSGPAPAPADARRVLAALDEWSATIAAGGADALGDALLADVTAGRETGPAPAEDERMLRVPASVVDKLLSLVGEAVVLNAQVRSRVRHAAVRAREMRLRFDALRALVGDFDQHVDAASGGSDAAARRSSSFDPLELEQYNELHSLGRRIAEVADDADALGKDALADYAQIDELLSSEARLNRELEASVQRTRMVAVGSIAGRLARAVRASAREAGKDVRFELDGERTPVDGDVLGALTGPLTHLLRNAVAHGIETPDLRSQRGKAAIGSVRLEVARDGGELRMRCVDDGGGLDREAILASARAGGLVEAHETPAPESLDRLVLSPGFSTRARASQLSGRGIGMHAVHTAVEALGGSVHLDSRAGVGLAVELRLPVSLVATHALLLRAGARTVALASRGVVRLLQADAGERVEGESGAAFRVEGEDYPIAEFEALVDLDATRAKPSRRPRTVLLVETDAGERALSVEACVGARDVVVKPLGAYLPPLPGVLGVTLLGDGSVAPVFDVARLFAAPAPARRRRRPLAEAPPVLVVEDSVSARRALVQVLEDAGYRVEQAGDGVAALDAAKAHKPFAVITDLEMPRMNGMELVRALRARDELADVPVIMVTSRTTARHRAEGIRAGVNVYLNKPFNADVLLSHVSALHAARSSADT